MTDKIYSLEQLKVLIARREYERLLKLHSIDNDNEVSGNAQEDE